MFLKYELLKLSVDFSFSAVLPFLWDFSVFETCKAAEHTMVLCTL